jgi:hypothetical protein
VLGWLPTIVRTRLIAPLIVACLLLAACGGSTTTAKKAPDYAQAFDQLDGTLQQAKNGALAKLGGRRLSQATRDEMHAVFTAWSAADFDFVRGIGAITPSGNAETICEKGSFSWKIHFPASVCPDVASLWTIGQNLGSHEAAVAQDMTRSSTPALDNADLQKVYAAADQWMAARGKVRQDLGLD